MFLVCFVLQIDVLSDSLRFCAELCICERITNYVCAKCFQNIDNLKLYVYIYISNKWRIAIYVHTYIHIMLVYGPRAQEMTRNLFIFARAEYEPKISGRSVVKLRPPQLVLVRCKCTNAKCTVEPD